MSNEPEPEIKEQKTKQLEEVVNKIDKIDKIDEIDEICDHDENTLLYLDVMTIISSHIPDMIKEMSNDELCRVRNRKGNGFKIALAELNRRYPGLKKTYK